MKALLLAVALAPPVTQQEALAFHATGRCAMMEPGQGITRPDGRGWITSSLPGMHRIVYEGREIRVIDVTPGKPYPIVVLPGAQWCPQFVPPGRDACGPIPKAFLWDAVPAN
jgi:hypothetical protein